MADLGQALVDGGVLSEQDLRKAQAHQRGRELGIVEAVLELDLAPAEKVYRVSAKSAGMPFVDLSRGRISPEIVALVPAEIAIDQGVMPLMEKGGKLVVAVDDPLKRILAEQLEFLLGREIACALATPSALAEALTKNYGAPADDSAESAVASGMGVGEEDEGNDAPIVRLVTRTFQDALAERASDIHVEPGHGRLRVRFRVDGMLRDVAEHPAHLSAPLLSRLKIMARMDIAEKRKPQDGRISLKIGGRDVDVRASVLPSNHGETMVMRLLDRSANLIPLPDLGFGTQQLNWFRNTISRPSGIVLVTGPTGSGKTTTLYAALAELNRSDVKIITAEDPVEYHLSGVNQVQVAPRIGLTFSRILRAMLRCAPNVILVGEIRDLETAEIAIQASLTGHLVFSTLHTNDAPSALTRLVDLGVKPFLVSASVNAVLGQRLVRRLCPKCSEEYDPSENEWQILGLDSAAHKGRKLRRPRGCTACEGNGYRGRVALYETLTLDGTLRDMVFRGESLASIESAAVGSGSLQKLALDGALKALEGVTSLSEVLRVSRAAHAAGLESL
jgi:type IV pilus assembly protein PilB